MRSHSSGSDSPRGGWPNSLMSAPAMKTRSPISTPARAAGSSCSRAKAAARPSRTAAESAFTGGFSTVITATSPSSSYLTSAIVSLRSSPRKRGPSVSGSASLDEIGPGARSVDLGPRLRGDERTRDQSRSAAVLSRSALNSEPAFHVGHSRPSARRRVIA